MMDPMSTTPAGPWTGLDLAVPPVAIAFLDQPPAGLTRIDHALPAGCAYWKHASEGRAFYTTAEDHYNCPVGAFTHGVELPPPQQQELQTLVGTMIDLKYLKSDEVPAIPHRTRPMKVAAYAPLHEATFAPDVVVVRGNARQLMIVAEAARAAGVFDAGTTMGRPACAMLPHALDSAAAVASLACIGNRVYNALDDHEMYMSLPGRHVGAVADQLRRSSRRTRPLNSSIVSARRRTSRVGRPSARRAAGSRLVRGLLAAVIVLLAARSLSASPQPPVLRWGGDAEGGAPFVEADPANPDALRRLRRRDRRPHRTRARPAPRVRPGDVQRARPVSQRAATSTSG